MSNKIELNPNKSSILEFNVNVTGINSMQPNVRFVIHNVDNKIDWIVPCTHVSESKYSASFPEFGNIVSDSYKYSIEVILNEYYFIPSSGELIFIKQPSVTMEDISQKISISTSADNFSISQPEIVPPLIENKIIATQEKKEVIFNDNDNILLNKFEQYIKQLSKK